MEFIGFAVFAALVILVMFLKEAYDERVRTKKFVHSLREEFGQLHKREYGAEEYEAIAHYFRTHTTEDSIDDITWNDLSMDVVYAQLDDTFSSSGDEILYYLLRTPRQEKGSLLHLEALVDFFKKNPEKRIEVQTNCAKLGRTGRFSLYDYIENLDILGKRSNLKHIVMDLLFIPLIGITIDNPSIGLLAMICLMVYNIISYFKEKNEIDPYIVSFAYIMRLIMVARKIDALDLSEAGKEEQEKLRDAIKHMQRFKAGSFWILSNARMSGSGNPLDLLMDYIRMVFHVDLIKFNDMLAEVVKHKEDINSMFYHIGMLEASIAVLSFRIRMGEEYCVPEFTDQKVYEAQNLYHPLISDPVKNSIRANRGVLLTGSNASGKSTFLKTVAINGILAQTIHTVLADSYRSCFYRIYSSMSLKDDIGEGDSYYIVEIKAIKRILEAASKNDAPVLCFVDEVLRGTNTVERIAASSQILQFLGKTNVMCFAATHDVELTELLTGCYDNYHFEEDIEDNDIRFNYRLLKDKASTRNAIKLLCALGYDESITSKAFVQAERFTNTGTWSLV